MSALADQLLALAQHTGAPDVVEDAAHMLKYLEGVRAERDILQEIVDEQRAQIAQLVSRTEELTQEVASVTDERRHAVAALSKELDKVRAQRDAELLDAEALRPIADAQYSSYTLAGLYMAERDLARRLVCELQCDPPERFIGVPHEVAQMYGWDCFPGGDTMTTPEEADHG